MIDDDNNFIIENYNNLLNEWEKSYVRLKIDYNKNLVSEKYTNWNISSKYYYDQNKCIFCGIQKNLLNCDNCKCTFCKNHIYIRKQLNRCKNCHNNYFFNQIDSIYIKNSDILEKEKDDYKLDLIYYNKYFLEISEKIVTLSKEIVNIKNNNKENNNLKKELIKKYKNQYSNLKAKIVKLKESFLIINKDVNLIKNKYTEEKWKIKKLKNNPKAWSGDFKNKILYNLSSEIHNKILNIKNI